MNNIKNFGPQLSYAITGTGASSTPVAIAQPNVTQPSITTAQNLVDMRVYNGASAAAFVTWSYGGTATATANALNAVCVAPGATEVFNVGPATSVAVLLSTSTSTGTVYVSFGDGT